MERSNAVDVIVRKVRLKKEGGMRKFSGFAFNDVASILNATRE